MTLGDRIRKLRKSQDLTQQEFADRIGVKRNTVATYEIGRSEPVDAVFSLICREFNVLEKWLRYGEGPMFKEPKSESLDDLLSGLLDGDNVTDEDRVLIKNFLELSDDSRKAVIDFVQKCAKELAAPMPPPAADTDIVAKLEALEQQNRELIARLETLEKEDTEREVAEPVLKSVFLSQFR